MLPRRLLTSLQTKILQRPKRVLVASGLLLLLAAALGSGVEFRTSRNELAPPDDPDQQRWLDLLEDYTGTQTLIACAEALPGAPMDGGRLREFVDRLAVEVERDPLVDYVFHRVDVDWITLRGLYLVPADSLQAAVDAVEDESVLLGRLESVGGLADLNELVAERIRRGLEQGSAVPAGDGSAENALAGLLRGVRGFLERPQHSVDEWTRPGNPLTLLAGETEREATDGYLHTRDGKTYFLLIHQRGSDDTLDHHRDLVASIRGHADKVSRSFPGVRVALTGQPAMAVEEMDTVRRDTWVTSLAAVVGVTLLTFLVFRWRTHALLVLAALAFGVVWALGAVRIPLLMPGYLNLITSSFISTLVGVGVAYGIHPVSEYELQGAHTGDPMETILESYRRTGAAVTTAAVTTAAAFFSIRLMRFKGFAELGLVAGVGVLLCLVASLVTLPALLLVYGRWRSRRDRAMHRSPTASVVDRFWVERLAGNICRYPRVVTVLALGLTLAAAWSAYDGLSFSTDIVDLLPRNAESVKYQMRMVRDSDLSPLYNVVAVTDLQALAELRERAEAEEAIARFESILQFLPTDVDASRAALIRLQGLLDGIRLPSAMRPIDPDVLASSFASLENALDAAAGEAFGAGLGPLAAGLEEARIEAAASREVIAAAAQEDVAAWERGQHRLLDWSRRSLDWLREAASVEPPTSDGLPPALRDRFLTRSGKPLALLFPAGDVFDRDQLRDYVEASRRVSAEATGFPLVFHKMANRILAGFQWAVVVGAAAVLVILLIDYRNVKDAVLTMVPLVMGSVWMMGGMRLGGWDFNFANLVAIPLIIGVGIDNGVHVIQRVRLEGAEGMGGVLRHTGRAILIASLTTMVGFGSLAFFASHRGLSSLGVALLLGVGSCLITSTVVLPNLMVALGLVKR